MATEVGQLHQVIADAQLRIMDVVEWLRDEVTPHLPIVQNMGTIAVHPTCSTNRAFTSRAFTSRTQRRQSRPVTKSSAQNQHRLRRRRGQVRLLSTSVRLYAH